MMDGQNCKNAKFQTAPYVTKISLLIFTKLSFSLQRDKINFSLNSLTICHF